MSVRRFWSTSGLRRSTQEAAVGAVAGPGVVAHAIGRRHPHHDRLAQRVHLVEAIHRLVHVPLVAAEGLLGEEEVLPVLHVEDGEAAQRVLVVAGRVVDAHRARLAFEVHLEHVGDLAALLAEEVRPQRAVGLVGRQHVVGTLRPRHLVALAQARLELEGPLGELDLEPALRRGRLAGQKVALPVGGGAQHQPLPRGQRVGDADSHGGRV